MEMAGAARGAVSSLLGSLSSVLVDEVKQLWGVRRALQSIKDEMESMNSFLLDLEEVDRPSHQQRTWMRQVRDLAKSAERCIGLQQALILREGHRSKGFLGYLPPVQTLHARHKLAEKVRELNERIKVVNERRLRYDAKILEKSGAKPSGPKATSLSSQAAGRGDEGIIPSYDEQTPKDEAMSTLAFAEPRILEKCTQELVYWLSDTEEMARLPWLNEDSFPSIAIAAPGKEDGADVAREALAHPSVATKFELKLWITFPWFWPGWPSYTLKKILGELLPEPREGGWAKTKKLDRKIEEIVKKTKEHLQAACTKRSPRVVPLEPLDILCDILQELLPEARDCKWAKTEELDRKIEVLVVKTKEHMQAAGTVPLEPFDILCELLPAVHSVSKDQIEGKINKTAVKIKEYLEELDTTRSWIGLDHSDYVGILRELLPQSKEDMDKLDGDQMSYEKIKEILENIEEHLLVQEIKEHLEGKRTIIVLDGINYAYKWWETKRALNQLGCAAGSAVIATTRYTQGSEEFCNPTRDAIIYSLVHFYYSQVLLFTSRRKNKDCNEYIFRDILQLCEHHEFCMKMFVHAMYANPDKSREDLEKLRDTLVFSGPLYINAKKMLMFSYGDLPRDYKTCLLYLAIFPRGCNIRRSALVGRWAAEGLITKEYWASSVHRAERCFDELVDRWLVYPGDVGTAGKVKSCVVHDIVHEFITMIAWKEHFVETRWPRGLARHFSVLSDVQLRSSERMPGFLRKLRTSPQYPLVKVLDLEGCRPFKMKQDYLKNICNKMLLLKYLSLRNTDITKLPKEIDNLRLLEVLDIRHTHAMHASATKDLMLLKLKRLLAGCIHPSPCDELGHKSFSAARLPHGIGKMTNMEVLSHVEASEHGVELIDIAMLWQLRKLGVVIHDKKSHLKLLVRVIGDLSESLQALSISIKPPQASSHGTPSNTNISFENPPKHLESLSISGSTSGQLLPLLAKSGDRLTKVTLHDTLLNQNDLKDLVKLPKLHCVRLWHKSYIASKLTFKNDEFQNLKNLLVEGSNMTEINFEDEAAPELENIILNFANIISIIFGEKAAPKLEKIVLSSTNITGITFKNGATPNLKEIVLSSTTTTHITFENGATPNLKKIVLSFTNVEFLSGINYLPVLKELELNGSRIASALLSLFTNANQLAKVTLRDTMLKQGDLQILAKQPNLRFLMLLDKSCDEIQLTFNKEEFRNLKLLVVECFGITNISFAAGAAPKLEKIVWSFTDIESLSGIDNLLKLKELEFKGDKIPDLVTESIEKHPNRPFLIHTK